MQIIAVANDITAQVGAFGPREDALFRAAGELALKERLPLIYLAANSGARVGVALEVRCPGLRLLQASCGPRVLTCHICVSCCCFYEQKTTQLTVCCGVVLTGS